MSKNNRPTDRTQWGELFTDTPEYQDFKSLRDDRDAAEALLAAFLTKGSTEGAKQLKPVIETCKTLGLQPYLAQLDAALKSNDNMRVTQRLTYLSRFVRNEMPYFVSSAAGVCPRMPTADELVEMDPNNPRHPSNTRAKHGAAFFGNFASHK